MDVILVPRCSVEREQFREKVGSRVRPHASKNSYRFHVDILQCRTAFCKAGPYRPVFRYFIEIICVLMKYVLGYTPEMVRSAFPAISEKYLSGGLDV
jgi:hypothetical protein